MARIAKLIYLGLLLTGYGMILANDGKPRPNYNAGVSTIALIIELTLLGLSGFFKF